MPCLLYTSERWRTQLGDRTEEFLQMAARAERETGLRLGGRAYVRPKQTPDERLAPYYSLRKMCIRDRGYTFLPPFRTRGMTGNRL